MRKRLLPLLAVFVCSCGQPKSSEINQRTNSTDPSGVEDISNSNADSTAQSDSDRATEGMCVPVESRIRFLSEKVAYDAVCSSEVQNGRCKNGQLVDWDGSHLPI